MNKPTTTCLGQFLKTVREQRGYENIQEYVSHYKIPVSYVYYTEIESGKKKISLETAGELCESLKVDYVAFYYHVLKDILPAEIQDDFLSLVPLHKTTDKEELDRKASSIKQAYQKNQLSRLSSATSIMSEEAEAFFVEHPELHSLVCAIYCVSSTTETELERVMKQLNISISIDEIINKFQALGIIDVTDGQPRIIKRLYDIIVTNDQRALASIVEELTRKVISQGPNTMFPNADDPSCFFGIVGLTKEKQNELRAFLADLDAEFDSYHSKDSDSEPQLMTAVFSPTRQYSL